MLTFAKSFTSAINRDDKSLTNNAKNEPRVGSSSEMKIFKKPTAKIKATKGKAITVHIDASGVIV
jgi:hypothetical protein